MTEHVLECDWNKVCHVYKEVRAEGIIDRTYDAHRDFYGKGQCCQCGIKCECARLRACEERVRKDQTDRCVAAFHDRISDSDLDDLISDDEKDIVAEAIRRAPQMP